MGARKEVDIDGGYQAGHGLDIAAEESPVAVEAEINPESRHDVGKDDAEANLLRP